MQPSIGALIAFALLSGLVTGCSDDDPPGAGPEATRAIEESAQERAELMVLQLSDLPSGWQASPREGDDPSEEFLTCSGIDLGGVTYLGDAGSENFMMDDAQVNTDAKILESNSEAQSVVSAFKDGLIGAGGARCYQEELQQTLDDEGGIDYEVGEVTVGELDVRKPAFVEDLVAYRIKIPIRAQADRGTLFADEVILRQDDVVVDIATIDLRSPLDASLRDQLIRTIGARASEVRVAR